MIAIENLIPDKNITIEKVYGIIYRIYCKPENKSYIGQTLSHYLIKDKWFPSGIQNRIRKHFDKANTVEKKSILYNVLSKYPKDEFEVHIEEKVPGNIINTLNAKEEDYIKKYNTLHPNGYNFVKISNTTCKSKQALINYYNLETDEKKYIDDTRERRAKDITTGKRFKNNQERLEFFKDKKIEEVSITYSSKALRVLVKLEGSIDKYRLIFGERKKEALDFANTLSNNVIIKQIAKDFLEEKNLDDTYKWQNKLDDISKLQNIKSIKGKFYYYKRFEKYTYVLFFYGLKKSRTVLLSKVSFGGKYDSEEDNYNQGKLFIEKLNNVLKLTNIDLQKPNEINRGLQQVAASEDVSDSSED
jgi:hypothetical protein